MDATAPAVDGAPVHRPVRFVLFDAGGTLLGTNTRTEHWYEQFFVDACAGQGVAVEMGRAREALRVAADTCPPGPRCSTPGQVLAFWQHVYGTAFRLLIPGCNHSALAAHYIERFEQGEFIELFDDTLPTLRMLANRGVNCGVVSNFGVYLDSFLERTGIAPFFRFTVVSARAGCEKPDPRIFEMALQRTGVPPREILFVGDHPVEDHDAARSLGMRSVLIDRHGKHRDRPQTQRIARLTEIGQML